MDDRLEIKKIIEAAIKKAQESGEFKEFQIPDISVERPSREEFGIYATNSAMTIAPLAGVNSIDAANTIVRNIDENTINYYGKPEIKNPGFINIQPTNEFLYSKLLEIIKQGKKYGKSECKDKKKIQVEFISSNPTGPLTVANGRGGPMGDVLANVLEAAGNKVEREFYVNNVGVQIGVLGHSILKDDKAQYKGGYIEALAKRIKEKEPHKIGQEAADIIVNEMIKKTAEKLGIKYDKWFLESDLHKKGLADKVIKLLEKKGLLYEQEEATWFKSSQFGDTRDRVLIKKDGEKTYLANDIAYHYNKFKERKFNKVIDILGADHHGDVAGLMAGVEAIGYKGQLEVILHQFISVLEKGEKIKMSKRLGTFVALDELLDAVGSDVIRFFFLMHSADRQMDFDLDLAREKSDKNPVYYVQYAYARINSILRKSSGHNLSVKFELLVQPSETELMKKLLELPEIIEDTAKDYQVQRLPVYAIELAAIFHKFYTECHVLGEEKDLEKARLALVMATKIVLENIFDLTGISKPEKM